MIKRCLYVLCPSCDPAGDYLLRPRYYLHCIHITLHILPALQVCASGSGTAWPFSTVYLQICRCFHTMTCSITTGIALSLIDTQLTHGRGEEGDGTRDERQLPALAPFTPLPVRNTAIYWPYICRHLGVCQVRLSAGALTTCIHAVHAWLNRLLPGDRCSRRLAATALAWNAYAFKCAAVRSVGKCVEMWKPGTCCLSWRGQAARTTLRTSSRLERQLWAMHCLVADHACDASCQGPCQPL